MSRSQYPGIPTCYGGFETLQQRENRGAIYCGDEQGDVKMLLRMITIFTVLMFVLSWQTIPEIFLQQFENVYAAPAYPLDGFAGVVVLGGAFHSEKVWRSRGQVQLTEAAERMTQAVVLLRQYPHLQLIYTGSEGCRGADPAGIVVGAPQTARFFADMGVPPSRMILEGDSTNTYENATFTAVLPEVDVRQPWLLLTSAAHMPRALATFRKAGWNVMPYPVDYQTAVKRRWWHFSLVKSLTKWQNVAYETCGWVKYWWRISVVRF